MFAIALGRIRLSCFDLHLYLLLRSCGKCHGQGHGHGQCIKIYELTGEKLLSVRFCYII